VDYVRPSVLKAQGQGNVRLASAIRNNVIYTVNALSSRSKIISDAVNAGKLTIVGADYDLDAGTVRMITG
jgi:carbonic anhydrase